MYVHFQQQNLIHMGFSFKHRKKLNQHTLYFNNYICTLPSDPNSSSHSMYCTQHLKQFKLPAVSEPQVDSICHSSVFYHRSHFFIKKKILLFFSQIIKEIKSVIIYWTQINRKTKGSSRGSNRQKVYVWCDTWSDIFTMFRSAKSKVHGFSLL